jgi:hypothetical protein
VSDHSDGFDALPWSALLPCDYQSWVARFAGSA